MAPTTRWPQENAQTRKWKRGRRFRKLFCNDCLAGDLWPAARPQRRRDDGVSGTSGEQPALPQSPVAVGGRRRGSRQARLQSEGQLMKRRLALDFCWCSVNATSSRHGMYLKPLSCFSIEINFADEIMKRHVCFQSWDQWWYMYVYIYIFQKYMFFFCFF